ncbi:MAG: hypothetical protein ACLTCB_06545 [Merdibacter sp.]
MKNRQNQSFGRSSTEEPGSGDGGSTAAIYRHGDQETDRRRHRRWIWIR